MKAVRTMILAAGLMLAAAFPAFAQPFLPGKPISPDNPQPVTQRCWSGSAFVACASGGGTASSVTVSNFPSVQPVSGPVTDAQIRATPVPTTVTNFPATQPVSGTVAVSGTVPITGIFSTSGTLGNITTGSRADVQLDIGGNLRSLLLGRSNAVAEGGAVALYAQNRATNTFGTDPLSVLNYNWSGTAVFAMRGDGNGTFTVPTPTASASNSIVPTATAAVASGLVAKAAPGNLYSVNIVTGGSAGYLLVFNSTTIPADGAVTPVKCMPIAANTGIETNMRSMPEYFSAGISIAFSTSGCFTKAASATAFISADVK